MTGDKKIWEYGGGASGWTAEILLCRHPIPGREALC
jgi:hypothetical protein